MAMRSCARFIRAYQRRALMVGRTRAVAEIEAQVAPAA
jgi:hypothetical protein